jgi:hypothetical protein
MIFMCSKIFERKKKTFCWRKKKVTYTYNYLAFLTD